ncbi:MAG TPA: ECF-type sigma factor [Xanthomonadaceae bacterium]|nr:ECF-type sigma factor [Xanthomonadaceae bacterium]
MTQAKPRSEITQLLERWKGGDRSVENELVAQVYPMLKALAAGQVRRNRGVLTLSTTELAHEAYERLSRQQRVDWQNREHFLAIAASVMRRVAVDYMRQRNAEKRGGDVEILALDEVSTDRLPCHGDHLDWLAVDQALGELEREDAESARIVELRVFGGFDVEQVATLCGLSTATVGRRWRFARAWLAERLDDG